MSDGVSAAEQIDLTPVQGHQWAALCATDDVAEDEGFRIESRPPVAVFRDGDEYFCLDDTCTHEDYPLSNGWVEDCAIECALHCARFSLRTGDVLSPPATRGVTVHPVQVVGDDVYVALPEHYQRSSS